VYRLIISVTMVLSIVGIIGYNFYSLKNDLKEKEIKLKVYSERIQRLNAEGMLKDDTIGALSLEIDKNNKRMEIEHQRFIKMQNDLEKWKALPPKIKYKTKVVERIITKFKPSKEIPAYKSCEDGMLLNQSIGDIRYEDL